MAWQETIIGLLRVYLGDLDPTYTYSDDRLEQVIIASAGMLLTEAEFNYDYTTNILTREIIPDPVESNDTDFINFMVLKAACIIDRGEAKTAVKVGVMAKEMNSQFDTRDRAKLGVELLKQNWCKVYEKARLDYMSGQGAAGVAVLSPFRIYAGY